jgi:hypothetical protein
VRPIPLIPSRLLAFSSLISCHFYCLPTSPSLSFLFSLYLLSPSVHPFFYFPPVYILSRPIDPCDHAHSHTHCPSPSRSPLTLPLSAAMFMPTPPPAVSFPHGWGSNSRDGTGTAASRTYPNPQLPRPSSSASAFSVTMACAMAWKERTGGDDIPSDMKCTVWSDLVLSCLILLSKVLLAD